MNDTFVRRNSGYSCTKFSRRLIESGDTLWTSTKPLGILKFLLVLLPSKFIDMFIDRAL